MGVKVTETMHRDIVSERERINALLHKLREVKDGLWNERLTLLPLCQTRKEEANLDCAMAEFLMASRVLAETLCEVGFAGVEITDLLANDYGVRQSIGADRR